MKNKSSSHANSLSFYLDSPHPNHSAAAAAPRHWMLLHCHCVLQLAAEMNREHLPHLPGS